VPNRPVTAAGLDVYLSRKQVAALLGISTSTLDRIIRFRKIAATRVQGQVKIAASAVQSYLVSCAI
jgi:excisionase family DNA binding protein